MTGAKTDIIAQLQKEILHLQGFRSALSGAPVHMGLGPLLEAFPNHVFPVAAVHEFLCTGHEQAAATTGFIGGLLSHLMQQHGICLWISMNRTLFPPALQHFGVTPDRVIFIDLQKEKDVLWALEEALKCEGLAAVIAEVKQLSFTASRRLQLAVEQSSVTAMIIGRDARNWQTTAAVARWQISAIPSETPDQLPGVGYARWQVELLKVRNGKTGSWQMAWVAGRFEAVSGKQVTTTSQRKAG
jgi:protein ImuA